MIGSLPIGSGPIFGTTIVQNQATLDSFEQRVLDTFPNEFTDPTTNYDQDAFKDITSPGNCLEYFNGKLYFAIGNYVYATKTFDIEHVDVRYAVVAGFPDNVTMIARVNDGLFISTANDTYFLRGTSPHPEDGGFTQTHIAKFGAIKGTSVRYQSDIIADAKATDTSVVWMNSLGVFVGSDGGKYTCLSINQISVPAGPVGTATIIERNGIYQYIVCYNINPDSIINSSDAVIVSREGTYDTIVVNLSNGAHSRYVGYAFNSFFKHDDKWYGSNSSGIYELTGDYDFVNTPEPTNIDAYVQTPIIDFDKAENKQVSDVFINARSSDDMKLDVIINESISCDGLDIRFKGEEGIHRRRVMVPRGLKGNSWQFTVRNTNGAYFKLFDLEVAANILKRTI